MKKFLLTFIFLLPCFVFAQPVKILVGFPPGGAQDILARLIEDRLTQNGVTAQTLNKPGASGIIALNDCEQDTQYICIVSESQLVGAVTLPESARKFTYESLVYIKHVTSTPNVLITSKNNKRSINSVLDQIATEKTSFGAANILLQHSTNKFLQRVKAKDSLAIEYKGGAQVLTDIQGGHIDYAIIPYPVVKDNAGIRIVATVNKYDLEELKGYPVLETIYPGLDIPDGRQGIVVGSKVSATLKNYYNGLIDKIMKEDAFRTRLASIGYLVADVNVDGATYKKLTDAERNSFVRNLPKSQTNP